VQVGGNTQANGMRVAFGACLLGSILEEVPARSPGVCGTDPRCAFVLDEKGENDRARAVLGLPA